jgi:hypothetical protein
LTTHRAPPSKEDPHNGQHTRFITQAAAKAFFATPLFFLLPQIDTFLRDFSTFLTMSFEAFLANTQAMSLPYLGLAASKVARKLQSSVAKRTLELCANTPLLTTEADDCGGEGVEATANSSNELNSNGSTIEDYPHNS